MIYVALLRAVNVGGKSIMKMAALRNCLELAGFKRVATYIQSGNIIFETDERKLPSVAVRIERALGATFDYESKVVILSHAQFRRVLGGAPSSWARGSHLRRYVAFLRPPVTAKQALAQVEIKEGIDSVSAGKGALYMSTLLSAVKRSALTKLVGKPVYQDMTIRNYSTCLKILELLEERHESPHKARRTSSATTDQVLRVKSTNSAR
jgi:uncharacterized protein (DUF1697 family)